MTEPGPRAAKRRREVRPPAEELLEGKPRQSAAPDGKEQDRWPDMQRLFRGIDEILSPIAKLVLFVTIVLGGYQYFYGQHEQRVDRSLQYVAEWNSEGYRDTFESINRVIWPLYLQSALQIETLASTPEEAAQMLSNIGEQVTNQATGIAPGADQDVDRIFSFFERAALCANERLCDFQVLHTFLGNEARSFWTYFSRYAALKNSSGYTTYGYWTGRFADGDIAGRWFFGLL